MSPQLLLSIISSICLIISEILPFIKKYDSNGLLHLLLNISKSIVKDKNNQERLPLLNENYNNYDGEGTNEGDNGFGIKNNVDTQPHQTWSGIEGDNLINKLDILNSNINNITNTLNYYITESQNARQLKLQPMEFYELNYIINFIKVNYHKKMYQTKFLSKGNKQLLISQGYIIDYDSQNDIHTIKW
jgi:hypothetical protein